MTEHITLSHGNGGKRMRQLIETVFVKYLANDLLNPDTDAALLPAQSQHIMTTVDGFTVQPIFFPGGNIGSLCIHGTVNDLAVSGAVPKFLTLSAIIEEGLTFERLETIVQSIAKTALECGVKIVCGDTKVVPNGQGSEIYLTTTGIGYKTAAVDFSTDLIRAGDKILTSGPVGDHGAAVMLARQQFGLQGKLISDCASVLPFCQALFPLGEVRFMRDPTRGGIASVLHEINHATQLGVVLSEADTPVRAEVTTICNMLGYEPYYLANEGRVIAVVDASIATHAVELWKNIPGGEQAAIVGEITDKHQEVTLTTALGGERLLHELNDDPLPRIC